MHRFIGYYKEIALHSFNALVLFLGVNLVLGLVILVRHNSDPLFIYGSELIRKAYPGWSDDEIGRLMFETYTGNKLVYRPFVGFKEREFHGKYINVTRYGFRQGNVNLSWPPTRQAVNVFVFGGSTTFGYGVADSETIPSAMQGLLQKSCAMPVAVYNFGGAAYSSSQEAALFVDLMRSGITPDIAVFIDGVNESFNDEPLWTAEMRPIFDIASGGSTIPALRLAGARLPLLRAATSLRRRLFGEQVSVEEARIRKAIPAAERWRSNQKLIEAITRGSQTSAVFVWQPATAYRYELRYHFLYGMATRDSKGIDIEDEFVRRLYAAIAPRRADLEKEGNFLWLADIQENRRVNLYVDTYHYNPEFSREIGGHIAAFIASHQLGQPGCLGVSK